MNQVLEGFFTYPCAMEILKQYLVCKGYALKKENDKIEI